MTAENLFPLMFSLLYHLEINKKNDKNEMHADLVIIIYCRVLFSVKTIQSSLTLFCHLKETFILFFFFERLICLRSFKLRYALCS